MRKMFFAILFLSSMAGAHSRLTASNTIKPRGTDPGVKIGPCGGLARVTPSVLSGGQTITVNWEETIHHPGRFEFYFSQAGDANFQLLATVENSQNDNNVPHQYSTNITLPNVNCDSCTFQMIQVMLENPAVPSYYYSCADMQVKSATGAVTPTPAPSCP